MKKTPLLLCAFAALLALPASPAIADEGRIPIYGPTTITAPGHYVLTRDIVSTTNPVILIQADDVTLDLNGRMISSGSTLNYLVQIADGNTNVSIRNGRLSGGNYGIYYTSTVARTRVRIENVEVQGTNSSAIYVFGAEFVEVVGCRISSARTPSLCAKSRASGIRP